MSMAVFLFLHLVQSANEFAESNQRQGIDGCPQNSTPRGAGHPVKVDIVGSPDLPRNPSNIVLTTRRDFDQKHAIDVWIRIEARVVVVGLVDSTRSHSDQDSKSEEIEDCQEDEENQQATSDGLQFLRHGTCDGICSSSSCLWCQQASSIGVVRLELVLREHCACALHVGWWAVLPQIRKTVLPFTRATKETKMSCWRVLLLLVSTLLVAESYALQVDVSEVQIENYMKLASWNYSSLYRIQTNAGYENNPLLIHLVGSRYDIGYGYGFLLTKEIEENYNSLLQSLLGEKWNNELLVTLLGYALDLQWDKYLSVDVPSIYKTELKGVAEGAAANGCEDCGRYVTRAIVLANAPGDLQDFIYILLREFQNNTAINGAQVEEPRGLQCSMFAVWGDRAANTELFSARNLDWSKDTGVNKHKLVMVVVPIDGSFASVSLGFVGLYGTLAGMSVGGITVHEANLEESEISFTGFPWTLRLRYIMEFATDLKSAKSLWESTANTVGFNHMIASSKDAQIYASGQATDVALALETMFGYTAYFADNDPRERDATALNGDGQSVHIGFPLKEALWRTNHGYDPVIRQHYLWSQSPSADSIRRYLYIHDALVDYQNAGTRIGVMEALNITAIVGDKGREHPYECKDNNDGTNILSVTFQPQRQILYSAWERSSGEKWRPAVCSTYLKFQMSPWFGPRPPV